MSTCSENAKSEKDMAAPADGWPEVIFYDYSRNRIKYTGASDLFVTE